MARTSKSIRARLDLQGADDLIESLEALGDVAAERATKAALRRGARILRDEARGRAPRRTGKLSQNIDMGELDVDRTGGEISVGPNRSVFYGRFVELGEGHAPAQPFLRPAVDARRVEVARAMRDRLREAVRIELRLRG